MNNSIKKEMRNIESSSPTLTQTRRYKTVNDTRLAASAREKYSISKVQENS